MDQQSSDTKEKQYTDGETHEEPPLPARAGGKGGPRVRDRFRLSRLRTPSVSWLGGTSPRGLPAPTGFRQAVSTARTRQDSGARGIFPALPSRGGDGFSPSSRHGVCGYSGGAFWVARASACGF